MSCKLKHLTTVVCVYRLDNGIWCTRLDHDMLLRLIIASVTLSPSLTLFCCIQHSAMGKVDWFSAFYEPLHPNLFLDAIASLATRRMTVSDYKVKRYKTIETWLQKESPSRKFNKKVQQKSPTKNPNQKSNKKSQPKVQQKVKQNINQNSPTKLSNKIVH